MSGSGSTSQRDDNAAFGQQFEGASHTVERSPKLKCLQKSTAQLTISSKVENFILLALEGPCQWL